MTQKHFRDMSEYYTDCAREQGIELNAQKPYSTFYVETGGSNAETDAFNEYARVYDEMDALADFCISKAYFLALKDDRFTRADTDTNNLAKYFQWIAAASDVDLREGLDTDKFLAFHAGFNTGLALLGQLLSTSKGDAIAD